MITTLTNHAEYRSLSVISKFFTPSISTAGERPPNHVKLHTYHHKGRHQHNLGQSVTTALSFIASA